MSKYSYLFLGITACLAVAILGTNVMMGNISLLDPSQNVANVIQNLEKSNNGKPPFPEINLQRSVRGEEIISALGDKLPEVASWYGVSEEEFKNNTKDKSLRADKKGRLFYVDEETVTTSDIVSANTGNLQQGGNLPLEQTFLFHSKPGSSKTIYLDFTGYKIVKGKSAWAIPLASDFDAPAFSMDGDPYTFNDQERAMIQNIWLRVAEDYLAFDVDVTTEEPTMDKLERTSSSDNIFGNRILFTPASAILHPNAGGVSYVGVFNAVGEYNKISLVFPENLANDVKYMATAATHENGHALGLSHDGQGTSAYYYGQGNWAPIMGVGYYKGIVQWSKGEYASPTNTQDDLQVIQTYGLPYRTDDFGNSISNAGNAIVNGNTISGAGIVERTGDADFIKFNTGSGSISINVVGAAPAPTLDADVTLYNGSGQVIAQQSIPAYITTNVNAGTYYVSVKGVGRGDPMVDGYTSYGSMGQYYLSGSIVGTNDNPPVAVVSANPTAGSNPLTVQFSSNGSYDPDGGALTYLWNFGDGTSSTEANPTKIYMSSANYMAVLTVTDPTNLSSSKSIQISVVNQNPVASFTASYASNNIPVTATFDASASQDSDGSIVSYAWNFGDGTTGSGKTISHTYSSAGTYAITLTVTDNGGLIGTKTVTITAIDPNAVNAPTSLTASAGGKTKGQVTLKWADKSSNETNFIVERNSVSSVSATTFQVIKTLSANTITYSDPVTSGTYYYRVRAFNSVTGTYSNYTNSVQVKVR